MTATGTATAAAADIAPGTYLRLLGYLRPHRLAAAAAVLGFLAFAATTTASAWWIGWTTDAIYDQAVDGMRWLSPLACIGIVLARGIGGFLGSYSMAFIANSVMHRLRCELVNKLVELPSRYFDLRESGRLVSKLTYDVTQVVGAVSNALVVVLREGLTVVALLAWLLYADWRLTAVFLIGTPGVAYVVNVAGRYFRRYSTRTQDSMGEVTQVTGEVIRGHQVIRTFNAERLASERLRAASERNRRQNMKIELTRDASTPLVQLIVGMALAVLVWLAMAPDFFAAKTPGDFVAFLTAAGLLAKPIRQLTQVNSVIQRGLAAAASVFEVLDEPREVNVGRFRTQRAAGQLACHSVSFSYDGERPVLRDISFTAEPGQTIALVGRSGSGKSTLMSLLPRFYDPQQGRITLDGVALADYELGNLRRQISLVSQQVVLFNGTIAENIAYGEAELDYPRIAAAARAAHAMEFIGDLPEGLDTPVGDDAATFSGGQRQRLAIARALLKDAPLLMFDEATSALDAESEQAVREAMETLLQGRTTIIAAHRLTTVERADLILVLEGGQIVERGRHAELMARGGVYRSLYGRQFAGNGDGRA